MSLRIFAPIALLLCPSAAVVEDETSLMQIKQNLESSRRGDDTSVGPIGSSDRMTTGKYFSCAMSDNYFVCWGDNQYGQLGINSFDDATSPGLPDDFVDLSNSGGAAGANHMCGIMTGSGNAGFVDLGTKGDGTAYTAKSLALGDEHSCAILDNDQVKCWGKGLNGRLGSGNNASYGSTANTMGNNRGFISLGPSRTATAIAAGSAHTCALLDNGKVKCWGLNSDGQLGYGQFGTQDRGGQANHMGDSLPALSFGEKPNGGGVYSVKALTAGGAHTCALLDNDRVKCWGRNVEGQLGLGNSASVANIGVATSQMGDQLAFGDFGFMTANDTVAANTVHFAVKSIVAGGTHTCAILGDSGSNPDKMKCWGNNVYGQLGYENSQSLGLKPGDMGIYLGAVSLGPSKYALSASLGKDHTCVILNGGDMKCWGRNNKGQLGNGGTSTANIGDNNDQMSNELKKIEAATAAPSSR